MARAMLIRGITATLLREKGVRCPVERTIETSGRNIAFLNNVSTSAHRRCSRKTLNNTVLRLHALGRLVTDEGNGRMAFATLASFPAHPGCALALVDHSVDPST
ncbi:MAG: hypothetical protein V1778_04665 [bacterium]